MKDLVPLEETEREIPIATENLTTMQQKQQFQIFSIKSTH